jgi:hypothetical protein
MKEGGPTTKEGRRAEIARLQSAAENGDIKADLADIEQLPGHESAQKNRLASALKTTECLIKKSGQLPETRREQLLGLVKDVEKAIVEYVFAVDANSKHARMPSHERAENSENYQQTVQTNDRTQRLAHNALIDAIRILFRNAMQSEIQGSEEFAQEYNTKDRTVIKWEAFEAIPYLLRKFSKEIMSEDNNEQNEKPAP